MHACIISQPPCRGAEHSARYGTDARRGWRRLGHAASSNSRLHSKDNSRSDEQPSAAYPALALMMGCAEQCVKMGSFESDCSGKRRCA